MGYTLVRLSPSLVVFVLLVYPSGMLIERGESVSLALDNYRKLNSALQRF